MRRSLLIPACAALLLVTAFVVGRTAEPPTPATANALRALPTPTHLPSPAPASTPRASSTPTPRPPTPTELFLARPSGPLGELIAYNLADRRILWQLPPGMASADSQHYYTAHSGNDDTVIDRFDLSTGGRTGQFHVFGHWAISGVSYQGQWLALTRIMDADEVRAWSVGKHWQTDVQIVAATSGGVMHSLHLDGNFDVETISGSGDALFLIQHLPALNPDHYLIRLYDLAHDTLQADPLRAKGADEIMAGFAWQGVASPDGRWLLTLYLSTKRDTAFVHTLDLVNHLPVCIDLPSGTGNFSKLKNYTMALAADGQTLYATNTSLGIVAEVSLQSYQVVRTVKFPPGPATAYDSGIPLSSSVLSKDGGVLYFTDSHSVWSYDTKNHTVIALPHSPVRLAGLGISNDGQHLLLVPHTGDGMLQMLDVGRQSLGSPPASALWPARSQSGTSLAECPVTKPLNPPWQPPAPFLSSPPALDPHEFWYGSPTLWTNLPADGMWPHLPLNNGSYGQKIIWLQAKPDRHLTVTGRRLDGIAPPLGVSGPNDGSAEGLPSFIMTGLDIPTAGCWEITGHIRGHDLSFVVQVVP